MEKNNLTKKELSKALLDVRKAYRLLFEHQSRIIQLIEYIKDAYGMKGDGGNKFFSDPLWPKKNDYPQLWTKSGMWAWDFFYSYLFEFYFGYDECKTDRNKEFNLSVVEVCDTGYWDSTNIEKVHDRINTFAPEEDSSSCLIFVFECIDKSKKQYHWESKEKLGEELYRFLSSGEKQYILDTRGNNSFILVRFDMADFINHQAVNKILSEFHNLVEQKTGIQLLVRDLD